MTDRKMPRDNTKLSLAPLDFEEALAELLRVEPPPKAQQKRPKPPKPAPPKSTTQEQRKRPSPK